MPTVYISDIVTELFRKLVIIRHRTKPQTNPCGFTCVPKTYISMSKHTMLKA